MPTNELISNLYKTAAELLLSGDAKLAECSAICMLAVDYIDQLANNQLAQR